jgi:ribosome maturation factor RimP
VTAAAQLVRQQAAIVASAQDWVMAQTVGKPKSVNVDQLATVDRSIPARIYRCASPGCRRLSLWRLREVHR